MRPAKLPKFGRRGAIASEFALVAPIFMLIALATTDIIRVCRAQLRAETVAVQIGQIVSQCQAITAGDLTNFWNHAGRIAGGIIDVRTQGAVIVSAVSRNGNTNPATNRLSWQRRTGHSSHATRLRTTTVNTTATISNNFVVPAGQTLMVTEVFAQVPRWALTAGLIGTVLPGVGYGTTLFLTRVAEPTTMQTAPSTSTTPDCTA